VECVADVVGNENGKVGGRTGGVVKRKIRGLFRKVGRGLCGSCGGG